MFLPWTQNIRAKGQVTTLKQEQRPQQINTIIAGRVEKWWVKEGEYANEPKALIARAAKLRRFIKARPEKEVVLVAHGYFNHYLTGDVNERGEQTTPWWAEAELRTFEFIEGGRAYEDGPMVWEGEEVAMIRETEESLARRGKNEEQQSGERVVVVVVRAS